MNLISQRLRGPWTLFKKEILRFWRVSFQTVAAPVMTALLYLLIFSHVLGERVEVYPGVPYTVFLIPGLIMMSVLQNAFANSSSSLIQSKVMGNIIFVLLTPLTYIEFFLAFLLASIVRGLVVGFVIYLTAICFIDLPIVHPMFILAFAFLVVVCWAPSALLLACGPKSLIRWRHSKTLSSCHCHSYLACFTRYIHCRLCGKRFRISIHSFT